MGRLIVFISAVAIAVAIWFGQGRDPSFRNQMVPVHLTNGMTRTLLVLRYEVSVASWLKCTQEGGCAPLPGNLPKTGSYPVTGVNWFDVNDYVNWASKRSGLNLRLPTIEEWREINRSLAMPKPDPLFTDPRMAWAATYGQEITPIGPVRASGSFSTTPEGVADLDGNVWEWTASCYKRGFGQQCPAYIAAGTHESALSVFIRNPATGGCATGTPPTHLGFRLVADPF